MTYKEEQLIDKGYDKDTVSRLFSYTEEEVENASKIYFDILSRNIDSVNNPKCTFIGGQPGVGKTVLSNKLKKINNAIELNMDSCRMFHPRYLEIEKKVNEYYKDKNNTSEHNPGNDIATFTHNFAGDMINKLIEMASNKNYNMLLEWNMRIASDVLECMEYLNKKGYTNDAIVVATNKDISLDACKVRYDAMSSYGRTVRRVSDSFHDLCINTIPINVDKIYSEGIKNGILNKMSIVLRNGNIKWDSINNTNILPSSILNKIYEDKTIKDINDKKYGYESYRSETIGLNKRIINLEKIKQDILNYENLSGKKVVNM